MNMIAMDLSGIPLTHYKMPATTVAAAAGMKNEPGARTQTIRSAGP